MCVECNGSEDEESKGDCYRGESEGPRCAGEMVDILEHVMGDEDSGIGESGSGRC